MACRILPVWSDKGHALVKTVTVNPRNRSTKVAVRANEVRMDACDARVKCFNRGASRTSLKKIVKRDIYKIEEI